MMDWPPEDVELYDLGHGVSWSKFVDTEYGWIGILEWHQCTEMEGKPQPSPGAVYFQNAPDKIPGPRWTLVKEDPLTLSPSILCRTCGLHGFIREGVWVPA